METEAGTGLIRGEMTAERPVRGRLAPSPTGHIHLGNAWAFLLAWWAARSAGGRVILRLEDIDPQRSRPEFSRDLLEDLLWLGLDWDEGPRPAGDGSLRDHGSCGPYEQSRCGDLYADALRRLEAGGRLYPCFCTRKELRALAGAPHVDDMGAPYPGTCRNLDEAQRAALRAQGRRACLRFRGTGESIAFQDVLQGRQCFRLEDCGGDFALQRSDGVVAYQLAVAVDDGRMGITQVVRGRDILPSTPRQIALLHFLGYKHPVYAHIPLLCDSEGQRLAKRHASLSLRMLRAEGVSASRCVGLLAWLAGCNMYGRDMTPAEGVRIFRLEGLPRHDLTLDGDMLDWLRHGRNCPGTARAGF